MKQETIRSGNGNGPHLHTRAIIIDFVVRTEYKSDHLFFEHFWSIVSRPAHWKILSIFCFIHLTTFRPTVTQTVTQN